MDIDFVVHVINNLEIPGLKDVAAFHGFGIVSVDILKLDDVYSYSVHYSLHGMICVICTSINGMPTRDVAARGVLIDMADPMFLRKLKSAICSKS